MASVGLNSAMQIIMIAGVIKKLRVRMILRDIFNVQFAEKVYTGK